MASTLTLLKQWYDGKKIHTVIGVALSGTYATGGEAISFAGLVQSTQKPFYVDDSSLNGYSYTYDATTGKLRVNTTANTELGAGAYPAGVTGDTARLYAIFEHI